MKIRIISGIYGGRLIEAPAGYKTHPMSEKIRGAIFNMIGDIQDLRLLDAYSGSGAIAIEAVSRGAKPVIAVEKDKHAFDIINRNIELLNVTDIKATRANVSSWLDNNPAVKFDIIVCDPPYNNINLKTLQMTTARLTPGGLLILSLPPSLSDLQLEGINLVNIKEYGDAIIKAYKR